MTRRPLILGNWKMNTLRGEAVALAAAIAREAPFAVDVGICPPFPWLTSVMDVLAGSGVRLGAQDCWTEASGAYTGAVSPAMLTELVDFVLVGHSERRTIFGESDELIARKISAALQFDLQPVVCVGENLVTRQAGRAIDFVRAQLRSALSDRPKDHVAKCVIAYEPIWAIGTGVAATPDDAEGMSEAIRNFLAEAFGVDLAVNLRILYGGSVTPANAVALFSGENVDGALVGGASLKPDLFVEIIRGV